MPKLSLRDLFAVVTIVALALGWAVDHRRHRDLREENARLTLQVDFLTRFLESVGYTPQFKFSDEEGVSAMILRRGDSNIP